MQSYKSVLRRGFWQIVTPTFLLLGSKDKRVDMNQGMKLYKHLKARGVPTRCNVYDDGHALQKPAHDADCFVNTVLWFKKYLAWTNAAEWTTHIQVDLL